MVRSHASIRERSVSRTPGRSNTALSRLRAPPPLDLWTKPQLDSAVAKVNDGTRHVCVASLVEADTVAVRKTEKVSDALCIY
jgi:hypothetical protein